MRTIRQDAWQENDDLILAETVLKHIREKSTQLVAFDEAAEKLNRTSAACGFRWNNEVRKRYEDEIKEAKNQRQESKIKHKTSIASTTTMVSVSSVGTNVETDYAEQIIAAVRNMIMQKANLIAQLKALTEELQEARERISTLEGQLYEEHPEKVATEDYQALMQILQRARQIGAIEKFTG